MRGFVAVAGLTARRPLPKAFRTVVVVVVVVIGDGDGDAPSHHCYPDPVPAPLAARLPSRALLSLALTLAACGHDATPTDQAVFDLGTPDLGPIPDDAGLDASLPGLSAPDLLRLPYVDANAGSVSATLDVTNSGTVPLSLTFELTGDPLLTLESTPPASAAAGSTVSVTIRFAGSATQHVALGTLRITSAAGTHQVQLVGVAGAAGLPSATWAPVLAAGGAPCGVGTTVALPTAPFPHASGPWTDASVRIFVPAGYRQHADHDMVLHFHGHNGTLASTLAGHHYQEHVCGSGANVILVVPQGPVNAASSNFGKLMTPAGTQALLDQVLVVLFRDDLVNIPVRGELTLTAHSGGYRAVALNANSSALRVTQVHLYDALYGDLAAFTTYASSGAFFRSNYTTSGGTLAENQGLAATLGSDHPTITLSEEATLPALLGTQSVIDFTPSTHNGATRYRNAYGDRIRFGSRRGVAGGRVELRSATVTDGMATLTFLAPRDEQRTGFIVEASQAGGAFVAVADAPASAREVSFAVGGSASWAVRIRSRVDGLANTEPSDTYALTPGAEVLVVDGFERLLGGSFGGRAHDFAARVGLLVGADTVSQRALTEDGFSLEGYRAVIWLAGDQSLDDVVLGADVRAILGAYVDDGGSLLVSGSEVAFALNGDAFLAEFGASYGSDDAGSLTVSAESALGITLVNAPFGGPSAPYAEDYPDVLGAAAGGTVLLRYGTGTAAAVGIPGSTALVGFPLEVIESDAQLDALLTALLDFVLGT